MNSFVRLGLLCIFFMTTAFKTAGPEQAFVTRTGHVWFVSEASKERIESHNYQVTSVFNASTGALEFVVLIRSFEFQKALMGKHFNEKYMESDKYPKAFFSGRVDDWKEEYASQQGIHNVEVAGTMIIHGVSKEVSVQGTMEVSSGKIQAKAVFPVRLEDYNILIPRLLQDKIAPEVQVNADMIYEAE